MRRRRRSVPTSRWAGNLLAAGLTRLRSMEIISPSAANPGPDRWSSLFAGCRCYPGASRKLSQARARVTGRIRAAVRGAAELLPGGVVAAELPGRRRPRPPPFAACPKNESIWARPAPSACANSPAAGSVPGARWSSSDVIDYGLEVMHDRCPNWPEA